MKTTLIVGIFISVLGAGGISPKASAQGSSVLNDFNRDGASDLAVYEPATGNWFIRTLGGNVLAWQKQWGYSAARPVPADYDGDGITDLGVYDTNGGNWFILTLDGRVLAWYRQWGWSTAVPVPGDYDGDGAADLGVYDLETGNWYVYSLAKGRVLHWALKWGYKGDVRSWEKPQTSTVIPVPFDYDGDGITDMAFYYRGFSMTDSVWHIRGSAGRNWAPTEAWGSSGSIPAPGIYRNTVAPNRWPNGVTTYKVKTSTPGDGTDGTFNTPYLYQFRIGVYSRTFPVAGHDADGNGWDDHAVYDYLNGNWTFSFNDADGNANQAGTSYQPSPTQIVPWGFNGAVPANIYSTIYTACRYSIKPW